MKKRFTSLFVFLALALLPAIQAALAADTPEISYKTLTSTLYEYSMEYPDMFTVKQGDENENFFTCETKDNEYSLYIWTEYNKYGANGRAWLEDRYNEIAHIVPDSAKSGDDFYTVEYSDDGGQDGVEHIFHEYGIVADEGGVNVAYKLSYPKSDEERFAAVKKRMDESLKFQVAADGKRSSSDAPKGGAAGDYAVSNEKVLYKGKELTDVVANKAEISQSADGASSPIYYWAVTDTEVIEGLPAADLGVRFFDKDGAEIFFIPLEVSADCQDVIFSPDGQWLLLMGGSPMRSDKVFALYKFLDPNRNGEFDSFAGAFVWIDPIRFVYTRIDDTRDLGTADGSGYGLKLSVVLFDTATYDSTVLKEADETHNYYVDGLIKNESAVNVTEESVATEKDWGSEDKLQSREIRVEIPAAG